MKGRTREARPRRAVPGTGCFSRPSGPRPSGPRPCLSPVLPLRPLRPCGFRLRPPDARLPTR
jgi:hypothetical protein